MNTIQCVVNVQGYVKLEGIIGQENVILPYVSMDGKGVYIVNSCGNVLHVGNENIKKL